MPQPYSTRADVELIYGRDNVSKWADVNNNGDLKEITARVTFSIKSADDFIEDALRSGPYVVPLVFIAPATALSQTIINLSAMKAGFVLYSSRGIVDAADSEKNQLAPQLKKVMTTIRTILDGRLTLLLERHSEIAYPEVIEC